MSGETELEQLTREWREAAEEQLYWANESLRHARKAQRFAWLAIGLAVISVAAVIVLAVWL